MMECVLVKYFKLYDAQLESPRVYATSLVKRDVVSNVAHE
jgi:hypothetical protein